VWHAPDPQIDPELRRMEKDGLLAGDEIPWGPNSKRRQYRITEAGLAAVREWINTPLEYSRERDPVHLKAAYLEWADPESVRAHMHARIEYHTLRRKQWEGMVQELRTGTNVMAEQKPCRNPGGGRGAHHRVSGAKTLHQLLFSRGTYAMKFSAIGRGRRPEAGGARALEL
jgi:PadR family transcriptional regulator AphA